MTPSQSACSSNLDSYLVSVVEVLGGGKADILNVDENEGFIETMRSTMAQLLYLGGQNMLSNISLTILKDSSDFTSAAKSVK